MDIAKLFYEAAESVDYFGTKHASGEAEPREDPLQALAQSVLSRDTEKAALLKLKGFERVDVERSRGKHSVVCRHWLKGMCMKGEFCDFLHQLVYSRMPPCKSVEKKSFCIDRLKGCCFFQHEDELATDFGASKKSHEDDLYGRELSYEADPERFTQAFNAAILYAFPRLVEYA